MSGTFKIRLIVPATEQGAGFMAAGYARASGKVGVFLVTSGPGATNSVTPIRDCQADSIPVVLICGQVPRAAMGTDAFQEAPVFNIMAACAKHVFLVTDETKLEATIRRAFDIARAGLLLLNLAVRELAVVVVAGHIEVHVPIRRVGMALLDQLLAHLDHLGDVLGGLGELVDRVDAQQRQAFEILARVLVGQLGNGRSLPGGGFVIKTYALKGEEKVLVLGGESRQSLVFNNHNLKPIEVEDDDGH